MNHYRSTRRASPSIRPLVVFLIVASFGILFAGCAGSDDSKDTVRDDTFSFTEEDVARLEQLEEGEASDVPDIHLEISDEEADGVTEEDNLELDLSLKEVYQSIRSPSGDAEEGTYQVINTFLNVRAEPRVTASSVDRLERGDRVQVVEFIDAIWARVKTVPDQKEGYVAHRYIGKIVSESRLAEEKKKFDGMYFVDFSFVNVRRDPDTQSPKIGALPGQSFVTPISQDETWARISFEGKEAYIAREYLSSFTPNFLVRQDEYILPILIYDVSEKEIATSLLRHADRLKEEGFRLMTFRHLSDLLIEQEVRDARLHPKSVVIGITGVTVDNWQDVSDTLRTNDIPATLFLETRQVGISGLTEKSILTMLANGHDLQSGGYTGDDLRALTNAQVSLELTQSRQMLESVTKRPVTAILYPHGGVNHRVMEKAAEAGYLLGVGTAPERTFTRDQLLRLPGMEVHGGVSEDELMQLVKGEEGL